MSQFGEKGKALIHEKYNWLKIVEQLEDVQQAVLTKKTQEITITMSKLVVTTNWDAGMMG